MIDTDYIQFCREVMREAPDPKELIRILDSMNHDSKVTAMWFLAGYLGGKRK